MIFKTQNLAIWGSRGQGGQKGIGAVLYIYICTRILIKILKININKNTAAMNLGHE